jgi:ketosteroid isomerase-like protein
MSTFSVSHLVVQAALDALYTGDKNTWRSLFASNAQLFDDGAPRDLATFTEEALGHERFTKIHRVANEGLDVYGDFHSDKWGDFPVYFKFQLNEDQKIIRLEIGQA